jgi:hypothetical protein
MEFSGMASAFLTGKKMRGCLGLGKLRLIIDSTGADISALLFKFIGCRRIKIADRIWKNQWIPVMHW